MNTTTLALIIATVVNIGLAAANMIIYFQSGPNWWNPLSAGFGIGATFTTILTNIMAEKKRDDDGNGNR